MLPLAYACGTKNIADCDEGLPGISCSQRTDEENARLAMDRADYTEAIRLLSALIEEYPEKYALHTQLAAAHAARANIAILDLALNGMSVSGDNLQEQLKDFLPNAKTVGVPVYAEYLGDIRQSLAVLKLIPEQLRDATSSEAYAKSAQIQLALYSAVYSVMYLNQFVVTNDDGSLDLEKLATMSEEDALAIITSLADAGQLQSAAGSSAMTANINATLAAIDAQPGASRKEKLQNYVQASRN